jgi:hypothetical protein
VRKGVQVTGLVDILDSPGLLLVEHNGIHRLNIITLVRGVNKTDKIVADLKWGGRA